MNNSLPHGSGHDTLPRSSNGCWTCKLRRKKCDGSRPVCDACVTLRITCYHDQAKPAWMDGASKQKAMAERVKCKIKENGHRRLGERSVNISSDSNSAADAPTGEWIVLPQRPSPMDLSSPKCNRLKPAADVRCGGMDACPGTAARPNGRKATCALAEVHDRESIASGRSDTALIMFYLESLFPFLFPFYQPSILQGSKAWILELMLGSPVVRQATLCQSSYYLSLAKGTANHDGAWKQVLAQTGNAFAVLRQALHVIDGPDFTEHMHGAARIMTSIIQLQRFEVALGSFTNCKGHLGAAVALFSQLLDSGSTDAVAPTCPNSRFAAVINSLGSRSSDSPAQGVQVSSAEQSAFRFSSALLMFDDIIASTMLQEPPRLYEYHRSLLSDIDSTGPTVDVGAVVGGENWVLLQIGEIAILDAWKQRCKNAGNLDILQLVQRATPIKDCLEAGLARLETLPMSAPQDGGSLLDVFKTMHSQPSQQPSTPSPPVTQVWAHAAILYLLIVVSGWQPANVDVHFHVNRIIDLITLEPSPPAMLRTIVWPFCVAGCLADPAQEAQFRGLVEALQPPSVFGTVHKALQIMGDVWRSRDGGNSMDRDFAACFRSQGDLVLLV